MNMRHSVLWLSHSVLPALQFLVFMLWLAIFIASVFLLILFCLKFVKVSPSAEDLHAMLMGLTLPLP
jgi:hypothetical protein